MLSRGYDSTIAALIITRSDVKGLEQALCEAWTGTVLCMYGQVRQTCSLRPDWMEAARQQGLWSPDDVARNRVPGDSHVRVVVDAAQLVIFASPSVLLQQDRNRL